MTAKLEMQLHSPKNDHAVAFELVKNGPVHESVNRLTVTANGESKCFSLSDIEAVGITLEKGDNNVTLDFGGLMPAGILKFPREVAAVTAPLPPLVEAGTGKLASHARIWHESSPAAGLVKIHTALFANNLQITSLAGTFRDCVSLKDIPEALFYPLPFAESFEETFAGTPVEEVPENLFICSRRVASFRKTFARCENLAEVSGRIFANNTQAVDFTGVFWQSALRTIPSAIFANASECGIYNLAFAETKITRVPEKLFAGKRPLEIDGIFAKKNLSATDPTGLFGGALIPQDFLEDTRSSTGACFILRDDAAVKM